MIKVLKASAGSGKTFALTGTYLRMVLSDPDPSAFRHILAVTFTNKATSEMKARILKELHALSRDPSSSKYTRMMVPSLLSTEEELKERAKAVLVAILHDYSSFAVSTIDKFFQQTLRSFARELGQFVPYQIELDPKPLVYEAVDRVLDNVSESDTDMLSWLGENVTDSLARGERPSIEKPLREMAFKLKKFNIDRGEFSRDDLSLIRKGCSEVVGRFAENLSAAAPEQYPLPDITGERINWPSSARAFDALPPAAQELFRDMYPMYLTAWTILKQVWDLGIAGDFIKSFDEMLRERNIMCLEDSNALLRDIIDDCDAPFVYEKMGVRYEHFLLDEFQDTSTLQWDNFVPLLRESESWSRDSLVVGDVKQSIYRWRGSDWKLLSKGISASFDNVSEESLDANWRSAAEIVRFNNDFFTYASSRLGLGDIYGDVSQKPMSSESGGMVKVDFVEGKTEGEMLSVLSSIADARAAGASWHDITVLVRGNKEGALVASRLIAEGIPVITDDSLDVRNSMLVRRLVSLLESVENPQDSIALYSSSSLGIGLPKTWHSLLDLAENLLGCMVERFPEAAEAEVLYLQTFMDCLRDWTTSYGNNLLGFLRYWKDGPALSVSSPPDSDSVRIMTIHKSKGLEFKYVIFPFAENVGLFKGTLGWCRPSVAVCPEADRHYPVELNGTLEHSYFADDLSREQDLQRVDALNIFYVALTRAVSCLHIIACKPSAVCVKAASKQQEGFDFKNLSQVLYFYCTKKGFNFGSMPTLQRTEGTGGSPAHNLRCRYDSFPICSGLALRREESEVDEPRREGTLLHDILSRVNVPSDLPQALGDALSSGEVSLREHDSYLEMLSSAVDSHPEWFPSDRSGLRVNNEVSIFSPDGSIQRPDRVLLRPDGSVVVMDFKFGTVRNPGYVSQVRRYMDLYRSIGYRSVSGYVWYVRLGVSVEA